MQRYKEVDNLQWIFPWNKESRKMMLEQVADEYEV
jgi:hypothetical protein